MTKKLFYQPDCIACEALVLACKPAKEGGFDVLLDQTAIYPEGGGQPSDRGLIGEARVSHAREEQGEIWHRCDRPLSEGVKVAVRAEEALRRDHTQQHTGEHMLSGLAASRFGCANVGFHMAEDVVTIDLDKPLDQEQIDELELAVNQAIQKNEPTLCRMVTEEEYEGVEIRKKAKNLKGEIRIVYTGGVDSCTCCGTHCATAGEVGLLKILSHINYKGGVRITFVCGMRAVKSMMEDGRRMERIARRFSTKSEQAVEAVVRQGEELAALRREIKLRTEALLSYRAAELAAKGEEHGGVKLVMALESGLDMPELSMLGEKVCSGEKTVAVLFSQKDNQLLYRVARGAGVALSMKEICLAINGLVGGKGGGRDDSAQGSAPVKPGLEETTRQLAQYMKNRLRAGN